MKKALGFIITLVLVLSMGTVFAFADESDEPSETPCAHQNQEWQQFSFGCGLVCYDCGATLSSEQEHDFKIVGEYDEEEDYAIFGCEGQRSRSVECSRCHCMSSTDIAPLGHNFVNGVCTRCLKADPNYVAPTEPAVITTEAPVAIAPVEAVTTEATVSASTEPAEEAATEEPEENATDEKAVAEPEDEDSEDTAEENELVEEIDAPEVGAELDGAEPEAKNAGQAAEQNVVITTGTDTTGTAPDHTWLWIALGGVGVAAAAAAAVFIIRAKKK